MKFTNEQKNKLKSMGYTNAQINNLEDLKEEFKKVNGQKKDNEERAIFFTRNKTELESLELEYLYQFNHHYIKNNEKLIFIDISKKPVKGGKFEYEAQGYEFIKFLESEV